MARVNKFNIAWQIERVKARSIKDVNQKVKHVVSFLNKNKSKENYERVLNWLKMTKVAYRSEAQRKIFDDAIAKVSKVRYSGSDSSNDLSKISTNDLQMVLKDLKSRKYGFQFKKTPQQHTDFVSAIEKELESR